MQYKQPRKQPEAAGARRLMNYMRARGWVCWKVGSGKFVSGWPDWYCFHRRHGHRWVETKAPGGKLRASQKKRFKEMAAAGDSIYVLENESDYGKLFKDYNWRFYV